jgi:hypothetical protein
MLAQLTRLASVCGGLITFEIEIVQELGKN